jgi:ribosomal protein L34E
VVWEKAVVSSVARPGSETCKTNPIWPPVEGVGRGRPTYEEAKRTKRTQFRPAAGAHGGNCAKRTQFLAERGRDETPGAWDEGPIVQNKAKIWRAPNIR